MIIEIRESDVVVVVIIIYLLGGRYMYVVRRRVEDLVKRSF